MVQEVCSVDLRVVFADLYLVVRRGTFGLTFPFNEGEAEVDALARRAGFRFLFEASPRLWVASESVDGG